MKKRYERLWATFGGAVLASTLVACGGATTEAESPEAAPSEAAPAPMESTEDETYAKTSTETDDSSSDFVSPEDFQAALQLVVGDEALQNAMNLTEPGRFPIKISGPDIPSRIELVAATEAVEVVPAPEDPKTEPVLVFDSIEFRGGTGTFKYRYDVEGVRGKTTVVKTGDRWELESSRVSEY